MLAFGERLVVDGVEGCRTARSEPGKLMSWDNFAPGVSWLPGSDPASAVTGKMPFKMSCMLMRNDVEAREVEIEVDHGNPEIRTISSRARAPTTPTRC